VSQGKNLQLRSKVARGTLLALTSLTAPVATLAVTAVAAATATEPPLALAQHAAGWDVRPLLLDVGSRNDLSGQMKPLPEVVETSWGQGVVVILPGELSLDIAAGLEGLESLDDVEVADANLMHRLIAAEFKN